MDVMTVLGPVSPDQLGLTLPHEHLVCDTMREYRAAGLLHDHELAAAELAAFASAGGGTVVDLSTCEIGRDPLALRAISSAAGVHVVMGSGHYRDPYLDRDWFDRHRVDEIADGIVADATEGASGTGIRCGIIGEIGADRWYLSCAEERSFRAAARAHHRTGLTISTHAARWPAGLAQLDILEHERVDPGRVIVGHVDTVPDPGYPLALARRGCWVELDGFGTDTAHDAGRAVGYLKVLAEAGFLGSVLVSQDVFLRSHLRAYGGAGYAYLPTTLIPRLVGEGFTAAEVRQLTESNPQAALAGQAPPGRRGPGAGLPAPKS
jgi:phosphotriesterase-related protein